MPSDATASDRSPIIGRCYCGARSFRADTPPQTVAFCHCTDCRRVTGAPVAAFAAFARDDVTFTPPLGDGFSPSAAVTRWFCTTCGSPMAATYEYLPDQIYVSLGLIDQAADLPPRLHAHAENRLDWLDIHDTAPRITGSSRDQLRASAGS